MPHPTRSDLLFLVFLLGFSGAALVARGGQEPAPETAPTAGLLGRTITGFTLDDFRGKAHALSDCADKAAVVVCFLGTECPLTRLYGPRLQALSERFGSRGVAFLGVDSNVQDSMTEMAAYARVHGINFPILKDLGNKVADAFGATRTPQVFVLDKDRIIRYCGRVDGQFTFGSGVGLAQPVVQREDLAIALEELLAGKAPSVAATEPKGCLIGRVPEVKNDSPVTYSNQIARLIQRRCLECHREGQIAPFAMTDYEEVAGWGDMIAEVVREQRMPPWHANPAYGKFANENRLSDEEKQLVKTWVKNGCPEGNPADLPPPRTFHEDWFLPRPPDQVVYLGDEPVAVKAEGVEPYRTYSVDPGFTEDRWVRLAECQPGNRAVVHHIIVFIKPPGNDDAPPRRGDGEGRGWIFLSGFAPGTRPLVAPSGWAKKVPAGSKLVFQMHYTPIGTPQTDRSRVGLIFMDQNEVTHQIMPRNIAAKDLEIPPGEPDYRTEATGPLPKGAILLSMFPHMHIRGKSFRYELIGPEPGQQPEVLLDVPRYDFNWQNYYILAEPKPIPPGSTLHCTAHFDNSADNLANPDPTKTVRWGPQTWEEMMIGWYDIGIPVAEAARLPGKQASSGD
jgi:peroxiredoxin